MSRRQNKKREVLLRHKFFYSFAHALLGWIFRLHAHFHSKHYHLRKGGPYLIVSNHTSSLDPILLATTCDIPIYYVASEIIFGHGLISRLLEFAFHPIPKSKSLPDMSTIMTIRRTLKEGGSIGIFVEGNVTFTGGLASMPFAIGKLAKSLRVPLLFFRFHEVSLSNPRWATKRRKGYSWGEFSSCLEPEEFLNMPTDELNKIIYDRIRTNPYDEPVKHSFTTKHMAEHLERLLFVCPKCHSINTLHGHDHLTCSHCGFTAEYDQYGYLTSPEFGKQTLIEADEICKDSYQHYIADHPNYSLSAIGQYVEILSRHRRYLGLVKLTISANDLIFDFPRRKKLSFSAPLSQLIASAVQQKGGLIIYLHGRETILIKFPDTVSAYQFLITLQIFTHRLKYLKGETDHEFIDVSGNNNSECLGL